MLLLKRQRYIIPVALTRMIIEEYHCQQLVGVENTIMLLRTRFYWKGLSKEVRDFVTNCRTCRQCKHLPKKLIDKNGNVINTPSEIAENFNNYFVNIAANLKTDNTIGSEPRNNLNENKIGINILLAHKDHHSSSHMQKNPYDIIFNLGNVS